MTSDKKNISLLTDIFIKSGLSNIVISPGSRNAPIIISFANNKKINAFSIVDERSAAFVALGMSLQTKKTTAIACTSGSAVLNYASAISEAYYQKIPLLILTSDRPPNQIDIGDGQTIRQQNVFENYIKNSFQLPLEIDSPEDFNMAEEIINKALNNCQFPEPGPVHINIPFAEPLYNTIDKPVIGKLLKFPEIKSKINETEYINLANKWNDSNKVLIIAGQSQYNEELSNILASLATFNNTSILTETTSNLKGQKFIDTIDNVVSTIGKDEVESFKPDIIISFGGHIVSKMIKKFLRANNSSIHWHISESGDKIDTYFCLTETIKYNPTLFFKNIKLKLNQSNSKYSELWINRRDLLNNKRISFLAQTEYSDLKVFDYLLSNIPSSTIIHLGNSTPVRYSQLFGSRQNIEYNSNRGVSGIDGQISTAVGYSYYSDKLNLLITGDLGFFYDSNGLMNKYLKPNLKIIVINNSGGGIFRFIPGPDTSPNMEEFFVAEHNYSAKHICKAFDIQYDNCKAFDELENSFSNFISQKNDSASLLEIFTPKDSNGQILRNYFTHLKGLH